MASRAVVFRPVNADDVSCTPFEANTTFKISNSDVGPNVIRFGIHNNQITPISASNVSADNIKNADGTLQTPIWKAIDHLFYRPENKYEPMHTWEHHNPRYTEKNLFYSCSIIGIPYIYHGENIKRTSFSISSIGSFGTDKFDLYDDKYGNLRDKLIDSASFVSKRNLIAYWGFNDEFRHFELNYGRLGGDYTKGVESKKVYQSQQNKSLQLNTTAHKVYYKDGIKCTGILHEIGPELVTNGDMELNSDWIPGTGTWAATNVERSSTYANGGTYSFKYTVGGDNKGIEKEVDVVLEENAIYKITWDIYVPVGSIDHGNTSYLWNAKGISTINGQSNPGYVYANESGKQAVDGQWVSSTTYYKADVGATSGKLRFSPGAGWSSGTTTYYIDNVSVTKIEYPASGIGVGFESGSQAHIITENHESFNFRNTEDFAISFWCELPQSQSYMSSTVTSNPIITKRGVEKVPIRVHKNGKQTMQLQNQNITNTRYPFDISVTNQYSAHQSGKLLFRRSDGTDTIEITSSNFITSSGWHHIVCQKSGSTRPWGEYSNIQLWVDGIKETQASDKFQFDRYSNTMNPSHLIFGALNTNINNPEKLSGSLDEIRIYDRALETNEIQSLANNHYYSSSAYQSSVAGNVFYRSGQIVITSPLPKYHHALQNEFDIEYKSSRTIYENEVLIKVPAGECNVSMNPTLRKPKSELIQNQFTGSAWKPYITTIGLYNDAAQLIAVAKLGRAIQKRDDIDMNFIVRWDY